MRLSLPLLKRQALRLSPATKIKLSNSLPRLRRRALRLLPAAKIKLRNSLSRKQALLNRQAPGQRRPKPRRQPLLERRVAGYGLLADYSWRRWC
jgi:hypothetical protein